MVENGSSVVLSSSLHDVLWRAQRIISKAEEALQEMHSPSNILADTARIVECLGPAKLHSEMVDVHISSLLDILKKRAGQGQSYVSMQGSGNQISHTFCAPSG